MQTLTYGFKLPEDRDSGDTLFTALEDNITRVDGHSHNGVNSARLTPASLAATTQSVASGSWSATSQGNYRQAVTLPGSLNFDEIAIIMKNSSGHIVNATIEKISTTQYYVYTNDNSTAFTAVYVS